jgi:DNA polymerase III delta prime subunit
MYEQQSLLSEVLRPTSLSQLNLPSDLTRSLDRLMKTGSFMNLLFYGEPGIGKTSAARIILKEIEADYLELNGSFNSGDKTMLKDIEKFAGAFSLFQKPKIVFIDEADYLSPVVQSALRYIVEDVSRRTSTRFLMTANNVKKMSSAIRSRFVSIGFDVSPSERAGVVVDLVERYTERLTELGCIFDPVRLNQVVSVNFPDLRSIANAFQIEFEFSNNLLAPKPDSIVSEWL